jgi:hypothetical protein
MAGPYLKVTCGIWFIWESRPRHFMWEFWVHIMWKYSSHFGINALNFSTRSRSINLNWCKLLVLSERNSQCSSAREEVSGGAKDCTTFNNSDRRANFYAARRKHQIFTLILALFAVKNSRGVWSLHLYVNISWGKWSIEYFKCLNHPLQIV